MAIKLEEVRVKASMDYSKVISGVTDIRQQMFNLAKGVPNMLNSMLRTSLVGFGAMLIKDILPTWDEIWGRVYGVDEETTNRLKEQGTKLKQIVQQVRDAEKGLKAAAEKDVFDRSIAEEQIKLLQEKVAATEAEANAKKNLAAAISAEVAALREREKLLQQTAQETKPRTVGGQFGQRTENIPTAEAIAAKEELPTLSDTILKMNEEFGSADSESKKLTTSLITTRKQLDDLNIKENGLTKVFSELAVPTPKQVQDARERLDIQDKLRLNEFMDPETIASYGQPGDEELIGRAVAGRGLLALKDILPQLGLVPGLGQMSKEMQVAVENAMKTSIQKVRIVEVE
jgi:chromosome segregation ATPase